MLRIGRIPVFETALLFSLLFHLALWQTLSWKRHRDLREQDLIEIDLTRPFRLTSNPLLARRAERPGAGAPPVERPSSIPTPPEVKPQAPKEWILPTPDTKILEKPGTVEETPTTGLGGLGDGTGEGEVDWVYLTNLPKMLNRDELLRNIRRFYPEEERRAGRESIVVLDVHIDAEGAVRGVDVAQSGGATFDSAAQKVLDEARFSPAMVGTKPVAVKIRQTIAFQLETE